MGSIDIKQHLNEIRVQYQLEPSLKDVYVEGDNEVSILRWFFDEKDKKDVHVYSINIVEIPAEAYERTSLRAGSNHNKVIVLSEELSRDFDKKKIKVKCIADADYDRYLNKCRKNYILEYTDYTSIEMYYFNKPLLNKFVKLVLHGLKFSTASLMRDMKNVLQRIFLIRLANERLEWSMTWIDFRSYLLWGEGRIKFDEERFLRNYLTRNGRKRDTKQFKAVLLDFKKQMHQDPRHNIRGHDFTYLFFLAVKKFKGHRAGFHDVWSFERALCGCLELDSLECEALFKRLGA
ncbi:MAG: hypothetical protein FVQ85_04880 [Planctomycetes bacterium]|nr:hypothetical protein [Planctomycetota bacterium]